MSVNVSSDQSYQPYHCVAAPIGMGGSSPATPQAAATADTIPAPAQSGPDEPRQQIESLRHRIEAATRQVRDTTPLAQSFTNFVTINLVANAQLASGGTAAMSFLPDDVIDTAAIAGSTYINVGTLLPFFKDTLAQISQRFHDQRHPWVLDPVAAGIGVTRTAILTGFKAAPPTIVRGNASEIIALADMWGLGTPDTPGNTADATPAASTRPAGVEAVDEVDAARESAILLARYLREHNGLGRAAVAVSGATDLVTDGDTVYRLPGGSAMMTKITGAGCSLGGVTATYLAVTDPLTAAVAASALYNRASEQAERDSHGPGSFQTAFLDALWNTTAQAVAQSPITADAA